LRLLLDTHVVLWWLEASERLSADALAAISTPANEVFVSAVSACEVGQKSAVGKLHIPEDFERQVMLGEFVELPITVRHGLAAGKLPLHHKDPFDRLLVAQARCEGLTLVTADRQVAAYDVPILPAGS